MKTTGLIILEGPDACGKTTLAKHLCKMFGGLYLHCEGRFFDKMFAYQTAVLRKATAVCDRQLVVIDRLWPSEICYANVFRGGTKFPHQMRLMDRVVRKHAGLYVFCLPHTVKAAVDNHNKNLDKDHPYKDEDYILVLQQYFNLWHHLQHRLDTLRYKIETDGRELDLFSKLIAFTLKRWQCQQYPPALKSDYQGVVGHLSHAKYLLVGEKLNSKNKKLRWPFYEHANSSAFLCKSLDEAQVDDRNFMCINALDPGSSHHIRRLIKRHGLKPVALGRVASEVLRSFCGDVRELPHPQFMRRFHHNSGDYARMLKETLN